MSTEAVPSGIREDLQAEREQLIAQLAELGHGDGVSNLEYDSNFADTSQVTAERGETAALAISLEEALAEVDLALEKIDKGTFGSCERCNKAIPATRLEAKPTARLCIDCASNR